MNQQIPKCSECNGGETKPYYESNEMGEFSGTECIRCKHVVILEVEKPRWLREEERELRQMRAVRAGRGRFLPSGDFELADEYGGY